MTPEAMIEEMAYVIVNPVAAGTVRFAREWPGLVTRVADIGSGVLEAARPPMYFRAKKWDALARVTVTWP